MILLTCMSLSYDRLKRRCYAYENYQNVLLKSNSIKEMLY